MRSVLHYELYLNKLTLLRVCNNIKGFVCFQEVQLHQDFALRGVFQLHARVGTALSLPLSLFHSAPAPFPLSRSLSLSSHSLCLSLTISFHFLYALLSSSYFLRLSLEFLFKRQYIDFCKILRRAKKHIFVSQEAANLDIAF